MNFNIGYLKLSLQRALLLNVFPSLRAVCGDLKENVVQVYFYHDGEISEDEKEMIEHTMDQVIADFPIVYDETRHFEYEYDNKRIDYPEKMPLIGHWVFYRYEP